MTNVLNGLVIGNFKDPNPITFTKRISTYGNATSYRRESSGGNIVTTQTYGPAPCGGNMSADAPVLGSVDFGRTRDRALEKCFDQLRGGPNLVVDWAERAQTVKMLRNAVSLQKLLLEVQKAVTGSTRYKRLPKGDAGVGPRLDLLTEKWLEYRYGWTPLVMSIYDIVEQVRKSFLPGGDTGGIIYVRGRSSSKLVMDENEWKAQEGTGSFDSPKIQVQGTLSFRTEMAFYFNIPQGTVLSDFTSLNPLLVAWELVPYSFVADWFVNVSQYLSLWENWVLYNKHFQGGYVTDSYQERTIWTGTGSSSLPWLYHANGQSYQGLTASRSLRGSKRLSYKDRRRVYSLPFPSGIRLKVNLNAKRVADSAALLYGIATRKLPDLPGLPRPKKQRIHTWDDQKHN
jgi:hypothetical protein